MVDKAVAEFKKIDSNFQRSSPVGKTLPDSITGYREISREKKSQSMGKTLLSSYFKKLSQSPQPLATTALIGQQPSPSKKDCWG